MFIYFDRIYAVIFFLFEIILFIFKNAYLPYPPGTLAPEIVGIVFYVIIQLVRLRIMSTGNKTEISMYLLYSIFLSLPVIGIYIYYLYFQVYCFAYDLALTALGLAFLLVELIVSISAMCTIKTHTKDY